MYLDNPLDVEQLMALDKVYTSSRYPSNIGMLTDGKPSKQEAYELYEIAKYIFAVVLKSLLKG